MGYQDIVNEKWNDFVRANVLILGKKENERKSVIQILRQVEIDNLIDIEYNIENTRLYRATEDFNINLIDSEGYELNDKNVNTHFIEYLLSVERIIKLYLKNNLKIHVIWYCISILTDGIEDAEIELLKQVYNLGRKYDIDLKIILTQCEEDDRIGSYVKEVKEIITQSVLFDIQFYRISIIEDLDAYSLVRDTIESNITQEMELDFYNLMLKYLDEKKKIANKVIAGYATGSAAIGGTPIPFSDAALLVPEQSAMVIHILKIYDLSNLKEVAKGLVGQLVISNIGKSIAGSLIKIIPGVGTWIGGAINASVAASITSAIGLSFSQICYITCQKIIKHEDIDYENIFNYDELLSLVKFFYKNKEKEN